MSEQDDDRRRMEEYYRRRQKEMMLGSSRGLSPVPFGGGMAGVPADMRPEKLPKEVQELMRLGAPQEIIDRAMKYYGPTLRMARPGDFWSEPKKLTREEMTAKALLEADTKIKELTEILTRVQKEPLILQSIERLSKDKKHAFIKKADIELRIEAPPKLEVGDEVLLHPKTMQIVEHMGRPPLEVSRFAPDTVPNITWDDIGGLEDAKSDMIEAIELPHLHAKIFKHYKKRPVKGILLSGPPGCGKTMLGKAAAHSLAVSHGAKASRTGFLYVKGPEILDQYVGQTERCIRDLFFDARRHNEEHGYPAVIFLDEADAILAARGSRNIGIGNTIVPQFLTEMDGLEDSGCIVIIATNRPDVLDPAIVRDGRIDRKVTVTRPNKQNGTAILLMNLESIPIAAPTTVSQYAVHLASLFYSPDRYITKGIALREIVNGAMLANCVDMAISFAIKRDLKNKTQTGLTLEDGTAAVNRLQHQANSVKHELETTL